MVEYIAPAGASVRFSRYFKQNILCTRPNVSFSLQSGLIITPGLRVKLQLTKLFTNWGRILAHVLALASERFLVRGGLSTLRRSFDTGHGLSTVRSPRPTVVHGDGVYHRRGRCLPYHDPLRKVVGIHLHRLMLPAHECPFQGRELPIRLLLHEIAQPLDLRLQKLQLFDSPLFVVHV